jgi:hypothetical protein
MRFVSVCAALALSALLAGCGGGGIGSPPATGSAMQSTQSIQSTPTFGGNRSGAAAVQRAPESLAAALPAHINGYPQYRATFAHPHDYGMSPALADVSAASSGFGHPNLGVPYWTASVVDGISDQIYPFLMIGQDPEQNAVATQVIQTTVIELVFTFADYPGVTLDPSQPAAGDSVPALTRFQNSPLFQNFSYPSGFTQYEDGFQRQNFWYAGGSRPGYHTLFAPAADKPVQVLHVEVPSGHATVLTGPNGSTFALIGFPWFYRNIPPRILALARYNELPIVLDYNAFFYVGTLDDCCIIGYHDAVQPIPGYPIHTYAIAAYTSPGIFNVPIDDIHAMSHELGEWMNDPLGINPTPPWNGGQVPPGHCQNNLEVGDALTGTVYGPITTNGFTYHPQELVDFSWFFHLTPSLSQNGLYSNGGTFTSPATCT